VPPGEHTVTLRYQDQAFFAGIGVSSFGCLLCAGWWSFAQFTRRSAGKLSNCITSGQNLNESLN